MCIYTLTLVKPIDSKVQMRIMKTSILNFIPYLKLHHLVLLSNNEDLYTIDFTPIHQERLDTLLKLITGQNVPAEIRLRYLQKTSINDDKKVMTIWDTHLTYEKSKKLTNEIYSNIKDPEIKSFVDKLFYWQLIKNKNINKNINKNKNSIKQKINQDNIESQYKMNLYICNCQHFSNFAEKCINRDES